MMVWRKFSSSETFAFVRSLFASTRLSYSRAFSIYTAARLPSTYSILRCPSLIFAPRV
jgi:hypothetical protein